MMRDLRLFAALIREAPLTFLAELFTAAFLAYVLLALVEAAG